MTALELRKLWQLHQIDAALVEIRKRAAALDPGRAIMAQIKQIDDQLSDKAGGAKSLHTEQLDLELQQKTIDDKLKKFDKELYGGTVVSAREVETIEKEIEALKRRRNDMDTRLLELMELLPPAQKIADDLAKKRTALEVELKEHQKKALQMKTQLESEFKRFTAARPGAAAVVEKGLLAKYESIRSKHDGIGMAKVDRSKCGGCGTMLAERIMDGLKSDRVIVCEECHRILYYTEGVL